MSGGFPGIKQIPAGKIIKALLGIFLNDHAHICLN